MPELLNVKPKTYKSLKADLKEKYKDFTHTVVINPTSGLNNNDNPVNESFRAPFCDDYYDQVTQIEETLQVRANILSALKNQKQRAFISTYRKVDMAYLCIPPVLGMTTEQIITFVKDNKDKMTGSAQYLSKYSIEHEFYTSMFTRFISPFIYEKINHKDFADLFASMLKYPILSNQLFSDEPFFQIVVLNEFLNHNDDNKDLTLGEYRKKNYDTLVNMYFAHDYKNYAHTKNLLGKFASHRIDTNLMLIHHHTNKQNREAIQGVTKDELFHLIDSVYEWSAKKQNSSDIIIQDALRDNDDKASYDDYAKLLLDLQYYILNDDDITSRKAFKIGPSLFTGFSDVLSTATDRLDLVSTNVIYYDRMYNIVKVIDKHKEDMLAKDIAGFILSLDSYMKKFAIEKTTTGQYVKFLEKILTDYDEELFIAFAVALGRIFFSGSVAPTAKEWKDQLESSSDGVGAETLHYIMENVFMDEKQKVTIGSGKNVSTIFSIFKNVKI